MSEFRRGARVRLTRTLHPYQAKKGEAGTVVRVCGDVLPFPYVFKPDNGTKELAVRANEIEPLE